MSIVVLKRKTYNNNSRISPISGGQNNNLGFSINNPRNYTRNSNLINRSSNTVCECGDSTYTIKPSTKTYGAYYSTKYNKIRYGKYPCNIVQPFNTADNHLDSQGIYIYKKTIECQIHPTEISNNTLNMVKIYQECNCRITKNTYTKPYKVISHSEYLKIYMRKNSFLQPQPPCRPHYPPKINNVQCILPI